MGSPSLAHNIVLQSLMEKARAQSNTDHAAFPLFYWVSSSRHCNTLRPPQWLCLGQLSASSLSMAAAMQSITHYANLA